MSISKHLQEHSALNLPWVKPATGSFTTLTVPTGSATPFLINTADYDPFSLVDPVNDYVSIPTGAEYMRAACAVAFDANNTGAVRRVQLEVWTSGVVWVEVAFVSIAPHVGAASKTPVQFILPVYALNSFQSRVRFVATQDSGADVVANGSFSIDFLK